jgi:hypothetical protein
VTKKRRVAKGTGVRKRAEKKAKVARRATRKTGSKGPVHKPVDEQKSAGGSDQQKDMTKAQSIREAARELGKKARPRHIIAALAAKGIKVTSAQVSTTLKALPAPRKTKAQSAGGSRCKNNARQESGPRCLRRRSAPGKKPSEAGWWYPKAQGIGNCIGSVVISRCYKTTLNGARRCEIRW